MLTNERQYDPIPAQRTSFILELLRQKQMVSLQEVAGALHVSVSTARRDLDDLARQGVIERSRGGAKLRASAHTTFEPGFEASVQSARLEKRAIGHMAASRLEEGQSVIFDSSTTVLEAAREVVARNLEITAVTNDLNIALIFAASSQVQVIVPGGTLRRRSHTLLGEPGEQFMQGLHVDVALLGTHALVNGRLSDGSIEVAVMKRQMLAASRRAIILADSSKFDAPAFIEICSVRDIHEVISDDALDEQVRIDLEALGVQVTLTAVQED